MVDLNFCEASASSWQLAGYILFALKVIIPLVIIITGIMDFSNALTSNNDEKITSSLKNLIIRLISGIVIFFIPLIIQVFFSLINDASNFIKNGEACRTCLLSPFSDKCGEYKATAQSYHDNVKNNSDGYEVYGDGCYYCNKEYIWTNNPDTSSCIGPYGPELSGQVMSKELCEAKNDDEINKQHTNTAQNDKDKDGGGASENNKDNSSGIYKPLTAEKVEEKLAEMTEAPTYEDLVKLAKDNYNMSEDMFKIAFGWAVNEAYDYSPNREGKVDHYLGYLCDCVGINYYMGYGGYDTADEFAAAFGGSRPSIQDIYRNRLPAKAEEAIAKPQTYEPAYKGMYLALKYPDQNAHLCYGVGSDASAFKSQGGYQYYPGGYYLENGRYYLIEVWNAGSGGPKNWLDEMENKR